MDSDLVRTSWRSLREVFGCFGFGGVFFPTVCQFEDEWLFLAAVATVRRTRRVLVAAIAKLGVEGSSDGRMDGESLIVILGSSWLVSERRPCYCWWLLQ